MKTLLALAALLLSGAVALAQQPASAPVTIRFVQTNDIDRMGEEGGRGGFARLAAVVKAERAKGNTFFVHAGDTLSPSLLSSFDKGAHIVDLLNRLGVDVFTPGNHEFDFGPDNFRTRMAEARFDILSSNLFEKAGTRPANVKPDKIVDVQGIKVGFFGLTTEETPIVSTPGPDLQFRSSIDTARAKAKELRDAGADLVVAVAHTPLAVDQIIARSAGVDMIISGHDEHLLVFYDGRTVATESGSQADFVVVTELTVTKAAGGRTVSFTPNFRIVDTATVTPDPETAAAVKSYEDKLSRELDIVIGTTDTPLDSRRTVVRGSEAAIGNLVADAMRAAVGADIAITNGGGIRAERQYEAGRSLTRRDIFSELPFGNGTVLLELTGAQVRAALENGVSQVRELAGRFPQVSGMAVEIDLKQPPGSRVLSVSVGGQPLDPAKVYKVATNDFLARGGDGYSSFVGAKALIDASAAQLMATHVIDYIAKAGRIAPKVEGRMAVR